MRLFPRVMMGVVASIPHTQSPAKKNKHVKNPLTYEARINKVHFTSQGVTHTGLLFMPDDFDAAKKYPTVVFSSSMIQISELPGSRYAKRMSDRGYIFFTFDHIGLTDKREAIRDAMSYLGTLDFVDSVLVDQSFPKMPSLHP